jgi:hypothetical protein
MPCQLLGFGLKAIMEVWQPLHSQRSLDGMNPGIEAKFQG